MVHTVALGDHGNKTTSEGSGQMMPGEEVNGRLNAQQSQAQRRADSYLSTCSSSLGEKHISLLLLRSDMMFLKIRMCSQLARATF